MNVSIACLCPPKRGEVRHLNGDTVTLADRLDFRTVTTIRKSRNLITTEDDQIRLAQRYALFSEFYMLLGITSWTIVDAGGRPVPVSHQAIRDILFTSDEVLVVSEAAEEAYNAIVLYPLVERAEKVLHSSPPTPMDESISPTSTPPKPLRPSRPSLTSTTQTDDTATITSSLDGESSTSPSSVTAA